MRGPHEDRCEGRDGIERYLNPTFLQMIREGVDQMQHIFDAVIACDEKHDQLRLQIEILEKQLASRMQR